jgi:predicted metal-dependent hydrolase
VRVTVPRRGSRREAEAFAARQGAWIETQQRRVAAAREKREREWQLTASDGLEPAIARRALRDRAKRELPPRLLELAAQHGLAVSRISIRDQRWRWGSCSRTGHICLNWRLVEMPAGPRLRADPRADAPRAHGSLSRLLEARRGGMPGVQKSARLAAKPRRALSQPR